MVFDGVADTIEFEAGTLMGDRYVRLQTELDIASDDLDDASERNLAALRTEAEQLIAASDAELDRVCAILARLSGRARRLPRAASASRAARGSAESSTGAVCIARSRTSRQDSPSLTSAGAPSTTAVATSTACRMIP